MTDEQITEMLGELIWCLSYLEHDDGFNEYRFGPEAIEVVRKYVGGEKCPG